MVIRQSQSASGEMNERLLSGLTTISTLRANLLPLSLREALTTVLNHVTTVTNHGMSLLDTG